MNLSTDFLRFVWKRPRPPKHEHPEKPVQIRGREHINIRGRHSYGLEHLRIYHWGDATRLHIGSFCSIASDVRVLLGGNHRLDWSTTFPFGHVETTRFPAGSVNGTSGHPESRGDVVIENDVWIGHGCLLLSGSRLADGSVLAAGTVLAGETEPFGVYAGNPARLIRKRFSDAVISELLDIRWWEFEDATVNEIVPLLQSQPTPEILQMIRKTVSEPGEY
jgi:acetyltransferase-like isoleucine patch superfamily enzyme